MGTFLIRKGRDFKIPGSAQKKIIDLGLPGQIAIQPNDFKGLNLRLLVKENDTLKAGNAVMEDVSQPRIKVVSPVSGRVGSILRGENSVLSEIIIIPDQTQVYEKFRAYQPDELINLSRERIIDQLLLSGLWPCLRQRPFSKVANPQISPKSIFVHAMNTEPLAADVDFILQEKQFEFQTGLDIIKHLTEGQVHLCVSKDAQSKALTQAKRVKTHRFWGSHPSGSVSTHIRCVDPIHPTDARWYVEAQDVSRIGELFLKGIHPGARYVALTGSGLEKRYYVKTVIGARVSDLVKEPLKETVQYISGSPLTGKVVGPKGFLSFYDEQLTVVSLAETAQLCQRLWNLKTFFLLKAIMDKDWKKARRLGILEVDAEDFARASWGFLPKMDAERIIRQGLDILEKEK